jgi:peroxiredoxin family protein
MNNKGTIVVFSDTLDKVLAAFNIATGAASMGMEVTLFFTFWGLNVVRKERSSVKGGNWMKRMMGLMNRGGAARLKLSKFNMLGLGTSMMKRLMEQSKLPDVKGMITMAKDLGVRIIACNTTMDLMGVQKDDLIPEVDTIAGVAKYVAEAKKSSMNLFI